MKYNSKIRAISIMLVCVTLLFSSCMMNNNTVQKSIDVGFNQDNGLYESILGNVKHMSKDCSELWYKFDIVEDGDLELNVHGYDDINYYDSTVDYGVIGKVELYDSEGKEAIAEFEKNNSEYTLNTYVNKGDQIYIKVYIDNPGFSKIVEVAGIYRSGKLEYVPEF